MIRRIIYWRTEAAKFRQIGEYELADFIDGWADGILEEFLSSILGELNAVNNE